ncbi:hypothetical protein F511_14922 [Dorcoceras hygrometricum]|uniref:Uncharacterized protein n=1 Tax=Dorcoceras hygrometricum TaxID=472368 RepID=A0A2Z7AHU6_9LAMI|nr:hypothetical protein F511_14922 [Dorcoceras hygrometricum]
MLRCICSYQDARASGNTALSSPAGNCLPPCSEWLNTIVHGLGNSFPGFPAGRGFDPAGSAPEGEEGLWNRRSCARPQGAQGVRPAVQGAQSSQSSQSAHQPPQQQQQLAQQSGRQRFRPRGQKFKKKEGSGSSGSGSSSSSGSKAEFCGFCGGKNPSTQCVAVSGSTSSFGLVETTEFWLSARRFICWCVIAYSAVARDHLLRSKQLLVSDQQWLAGDMSSGSLCDVVLFSYSLFSDRT